jgi:hypothetical protein
MNNFNALPPSCLPRVLLLLPVIAPSVERDPSEDDEEIGNKEEEITSRSGRRSNTSEER